MLHFKSLALVGILVFCILPLYRLPFFSNPTCTIAIFFSEEDMSGPVFSSLRHILKVSCICLSHFNIILYLNVYVDLRFSVFPHSIDILNYNVLSVFYWEMTARFAVS